MPVVAVSGSRSKARGFCPQILVKADGRRFAFIPAPYEVLSRERRWTIRRAREWARGQHFDKAFIDSRRRNGTTYWKEIRL